MSGIFKKFRPADITVTPYTAHKEYLVYVTNYTGSYFEHRYEQTQIRDHVITSSANTWVGEVSLSVFTYDSVFDGTDFYDTQYGKYQTVLSESAHPRTTNRWFQRAIHDSIQGMYYTNPDDPCYTLDNSGYEKEYRVLNNTAQVMSVPQRMFGDCIKKGSVKIQSGSGAGRITLVDDGNGNLVDTATYINAASESMSYTSQSILSLNFDDMYNKASKKITVRSINYNATMKRGDYTKANGGYKFDIKNGTRFFERSPFSNDIKAYNITPNTSSTTEGTYVEFDGLTPNDGTATSEASYSRAIRKNHSLMEINHSHHLDQTIDDDYTIVMRISASQDQPSKDSINNGDPHNFIMSKLEVNKARYPYSIRLCNSNANGSGGAAGTEGHRGHLQVRVSNGVDETQVNTTGSITGSNEFFDIAFVKSGSTINLYSNGALQQTSVITGSREIGNKGNVVVGATTAWRGRYTRTNPSSSYARKTRPSIEYFRNFKGGVSNLMMFNKALSAAEITYGYQTKGKYTNLVGNVFYNHGIIALTHQGDRYNNSAIHGPMLSECTLSFQNCHEIFEHEHMCHVKEREYLYTMNPSIIKNHKEGTLKTFVTTSVWSPYVTTIGLYNESAELLAIGKLSRPLKKSADYDTTYVVRYDT